MTLCIHRALRRATAICAVVLVCLPAMSRATPVEITAALTDLGAGQFAIRARGTRLLGYLGGPEQGLALTELVLRDRAREPRETAALALAQIGDPTFAPAASVRLALEMHAEEPVADRRARNVIPFIRPCAALATPESVGMLRECMGGEASQMTQHVLRALPLLPAEDCVPLASSALNHAAPESRELALRALVWCGDARVAESLRQRLSGGNVTEQDARGMVRVLAACGPADGLSLVSGLRHPAPSVRALTLQLMGRGETDASTSYLLQACRDSAPDVRRAALAVLADRDPAAAAAHDPALRSSLLSRHPWARETPQADELVAGAVLGGESEGLRHALERIALTPRGPAALAELARHPDPELRAAAIRCTAARAGAEGLAPLLDCAGADAPETPGWTPALTGLALAGLLVHRDPTLAGAMPQFRGEWREEETLRVVRALGAFGTPVASVALCQLDPARLTIQARRERVRALAPLEGNWVREALLDALADDNPRVRELAADALMWRGGRDRSAMMMRVSEPGGGALKELIHGSLRRATLGGLCAPGVCSVDALRELADIPARDEATPGYLLALRLAAGVPGAANVVQAAVLAPETTPEGRVELCRALGALGCPAGYEALSDLLAILAGDYNPTPGWCSGPKRAPLATAAIDAAGRSGDPNAVRVLERFLADSPRIRAAALRAIIRLAPERELLLERALFDDDGEVATSLAGSYWERLSPRGVRAVLCRLGEDEPRMNAGLIAILGGAGTPEARAALERAALSGTTDASARAWLALAELAGKRGDPRGGAHMAARTAEQIRVESAGAQNRELVAECSTIRARLLHSAGDPEAGWWARLAYLDAPTPERLELVADCAALEGNTARARFLQRTASWLRFTSGAGD